MATYPNLQEPNGSIPVTVLGGGLPGYSYTPLGYQQITISGVTSLTPPTGATIAVISVATAPVNYRDDGTAPTSTVGMPVAAGTQFTYTGPLTAIEFIAQSGTPVLNVSYYK